MNMKKFKDESNGVHEIEEGFEHLLPAGCIEISDVEAADLLKPSLQEYKDRHKASLQVQAQALIDAQTGKSMNGKLMMVAKGVVMLDAQAGRGQARDPEQDQLVSVFSYVAEVDANLATAETDVDAAVDEAAVDAVALVEPALPA